MTMTLIETKTLGSAAASIEFTSIPQDGTDLLALCSTRTTTTTVVWKVIISLNGNTGNARRLVGTGFSVTSNTDASEVFGMTSTNASTANTFGNAAFYIPNYSITGTKTVSVDSVQENNAVDSYQAITAGNFGSLGAITTVTFSATPDNYVSGTTISLYKITKGSSGGVTVS